MLLGGCFLSSVAWSTAPCQGSSGPFRLGPCLLLLHLQGTARALALSGSLAQCKSGAGASSALPLTPFPQGFWLGQNSLCLEGLQVRCPIRSCHFSPLPACKSSAGLARERLSCIVGQEAQQRSKFWKAKGMLVIAMCHTFENTTHLFVFMFVVIVFFCVWSVPILILCVLTLQEAGTAWPVFLLLLSVAL